MANAIVPDSPTPVQIATEGMSIQANQVYVLATHSGLLISEGRFRPAGPGEELSSVQPIDQIFLSVAEDQANRTVAVVMSGGGDDANTALGAVRNAGGLVLVQDPETAEFDNMPKQAVRAGVVDAVVAPEDMPSLILRFLDRGLLGDGPRKLAAEKAVIEDALDQLLQLLRERLGRDYSGYKRNSLRRRVERRMVLARLDRMQDYLDLLRTDPVEAERLNRDLLIGVTTFFRDPDAFRLLEEQVVPDLCRRQTGDLPVRIWVAGCSTGEEAYSTAILFLDRFQQQGARPQLQLFATDMDEGSVESARLGVFTEQAVQDVPAHLLERYFTRHDNCYRIDKQVRESIVFSAHNLLRDPPFSRMDLVVCRNVLIYLEPQPQQRLVSVFRSVLNPGGYLFLGSSETMGTPDENFEIVSKQWRIFRNLSAVKGRLQDERLPGDKDETRRLAIHSAAPSGTAAKPGQDRHYQQLLDRHGPLLVLVNAEHELLYAKGETEGYLQFPRGEPSNHLFSIVNPRLRVGLRTALRSCANSGREASAYAASVRDCADQKDMVRITVSAIADREQATLYLIGFKNEAADPELPVLVQTANDNSLAQQLEQELDATREDLQRTIERLVDSNDQLRAAHEEAMAMNEELQSAIEELESSKEELHSLNEELTSANTTLDCKIAELEAANTDMSNLFFSSNVATVFLDREFRVRRFTPACSALLHLIDGDVGRPLADLAHSPLRDALEADGGEVLDDRRAVERELADGKGRWYLRRVLPYLAHQNQVSGLVVSYSDVTSIKQAQEDLQRYTDELERQTQLLDLAHVIGRDMDDRILFWNQGAENLYGYTHVQAIGQQSHKLLRTRFPMPLKQILKILDQEGSWQGELIHTDAKGHSVAVASHWELHRDAGGLPKAIVEVNNDITERKRFEAQLLNTQHDFEHLAHHDSVTQLPNRTLFCDRLQHALVLSRRNNEPVAVLYLDLDHFKVVNDSLGHEAGDNLLRQVTERFQENIPEYYSLARMGGTSSRCWWKGWKTWPRSLT